MGSEELKVFSEKDAVCFKDIREVLIKHNALDRFGMCLIHKHFEMSEDEESRNSGGHLGYHRGT